VTEADKGTGDEGKRSKQMKRGKRGKRGKQMKRKGDEGEFLDQAHNVRILLDERMISQNMKYTLRAANPQMAGRPAGGCPPEGHIVMTP
jgi:hypothetical protein